MIDAYDFAKAKKIIDENAENIVSAALGMACDWFWTADTVWEDGEYKVDLLDPEVAIAGLRYSCWDKPILRLSDKDGRYKEFDVSRQPSEQDIEKENEISRKNRKKRLAEAKKLLQKED